MANDADIFSLLLYWGTSSGHTISAPIVMTITGLSSVTDVLPQAVPVGVPELSRETLPIRNRK